MKIIEIATGYTSVPAQMGAATEIVVEELTKAFIKSGVDVQLVDIADKNRIPTDLPITEVKVPSFFTSTDVGLGIIHKLKRVIYSISLTKTLKKIIKSSNEKILLHFHNQYNMFFFCKLTPKSILSKVKIAYTVHSYVWPEPWEKIKETIKKRYFQEIFCVKNADYVLVLNDLTAQHFVEHLGVKKQNIYKILNGVNTELYSVLPKDEADSFKEKIGISGKNVIFQVGSVCDRKNQFNTVKMISQYLKDNKDTVYMYAGGIIDKEYSDSISKLAKENGIDKQVIYAGELSPGNELNKYYNISDVTVFTSKVESFGLVIIESLSSGTPVILSNKPLFDLNCGYSVYENEKEFVDLIDKSIKLKAKEEKGRQEIVEKFSWNAVAKQHIGIFNNNI